MDQARRCVAGAGVAGMGAARRGRAFQGKAFFFLGGYNGRDGG